MSATVGDSFSFLPWVKNSLTRKAQPPALATGTTAPTWRPVVPVKLRLSVSSSSNTTAEVRRDVAVHGPGDVIGLQPEAVLKTTPPAGEQQYPASHLVSIEFGEEDLPWRYSFQSLTPTQINPWCFLLVLEAEGNEFTAGSQGSGPLPVISVASPTSVFPPDTDQWWPWAHVQASAAVGADGPAVVDFLDDLKEDPDLALSRVFSPRRLKANTAYTAFLVPAYEIGRLAGLGLPFPATVTATQCSWVNHSGATNFPVYYQWEFRTGEAGDFESLARLLQPGLLVDFGTQPLALKTPLASADSATVAGKEYILNLPGVIQALGSPVMHVPDPIAEALYDALHPVVPQPRPKRPLVTPPVYGRAYPNTANLSNPHTTTPTDWLSQLNLHPAYRSLASIGSQVIQDNQEEYMQRAWEQVHDIIVANMNLRGMQSGLEATTSLRQQHLPVTASAGARVAARSATSIAANEGPGDLENYGLHLTSLAFTRILDPTTNLTLRETIRQSNVPLAAFNPTFRRIIKPFGRYQAGQGGRPQRPTLPSAHPDPHHGTPQADPDYEPTLREKKQSLQQRDSLLTRLAAGTISAAPPPYPYFLGYQFNDATVQGIISTGKITTLRIFDPNGAEGKGSFTDLTIRTLLMVNTLLGLRLLLPSFRMLS